MQQYLPFTVLKQSPATICVSSNSAVATVLTVYGIETGILHKNHLTIERLQQYLPFTVLKLEYVDVTEYSTPSVATVLTVYGIETIGKIAKSSEDAVSCNSTYRLRY